MKVWQDVFDVTFIHTRKNGHERRGWVIIDKRTNSQYAKVYTAEILAQKLAEKKFNRILKEVESLFITQDE